MSDPKTDGVVQDNEQSVSHMRKEHMDNIALRLAAISEPNFQRIPVMSKKENKQVLGLDIENVGYFEVLIDTNALKIILETCGISEEAIQNLSISIRPATIADKNFVGSVIGGLSYGNTIEVYSSLLANIKSDPTEEQLRNPHLVNVPFKREFLVRSILHELRHYIQGALEMFDEDYDTFHIASDQTFDDNPAEQDAIAFEQLSEVFERFVTIKPYQEFPDWYEPATEHDLSQDRLGNLLKYLDTEHEVAHVVHNDPPGGLLLSAVENLTPQGRIVDTDYVLDLLQRIQLAVEERKIGHIEQAYLHVKIYAQAIGANNNEVIAIIDELLRQREQSKL